MKKNASATRGWKLLVSVLLCLLPLTVAAREPAYEIPWEQVKREAQEGLLLALDPLDSATDAVVDGVVYGYGIKQYRTFFEVGDAALFEAVGLTAPQGTITWEALVNMAGAVEEYNQGSEEKIFLLKTLARRFPERCALMAQSDIKAQWDAIKSVVITEGQNAGSALLTECVLGIESVGNGAYVAGIENDGEVYALSAPEMRYAAVRKDAENPEAALAELLQEVKEAAPARTGIIPAEMTYEQFLSDWSVSMAAPSETNFELFKQAGEWL